MKTLSEIYAKTMNIESGQGDKGPPNHTYIEEYENLLKEYRDKPINFLEIGVGYNFSKPYSMQMWNEYFTQAKLYAIDIKPESKVIETDRVKVFVGSQSDSQLLDEVISSVKTLDVIIDDGSHYTNDLITSFNALYPILNEGGIYIMEDIQELDKDYDKFMAIHENVTILDKRYILNRWDDVLVIIKK